MGLYITDSVPEPTANRRSVPVNSYDNIAAPAPHRGPKIAGVLSAKYTDDETGLVMCQLRPYAAGMLKDLLPKNGS